VGNVLTRQTPDVTLLNLDGVMSAGYGLMADVEDVGESRWVIATGEKGKDPAEVSAGGAEALDVRVFSREGIMETADFRHSIFLLGQTTCLR